VAEESAFEQLVLPPRTSHTPTLRRYLKQVCRRALAGLRCRHHAGGLLDIHVELAHPGATLRTSIDLSQGNISAALTAGVERLLAQRPTGRAVARVSANARTTDTRGLQLSLFA
jgi:hypothetical protein